MKVFVAVLTAMALLFNAGVADAHKVNRYKVLERRCSNARPHNCVRYAAFVRRHALASWQVAWLYRIPSCESGWNPFAYYGHPTNRQPTAAIYPSDISAGLYEFKPSTWRATPYGSRSIWRAKWQALAAAWMVLHGRSGEWVCQ